MTQSKQPIPQNPLTLWLLLLGNFIIGTGVLLPAGLLNALTADFSISNSQAGLLLFIGGIVVGVGAPVFAAFTSRIDRRLLLTFALVLYGTGHMASALAPGFDLQMIIRVLTVIGAALFTPQAAATVGLLVPPERRAGAIAFIFIGWSAASVAGIPLGNLLATELGWRFVYGLMAALSFAVAFCVWTVLRAGLFVPALDVQAWKQALTSPVLLLVFLVTLLSMSGQFSMFGYLAPILRDGFGAAPHHISIAFAIAGVAGVLGNGLASRLAGRSGVETLIAVALLGLCFGFLGYGLFWGSLQAAMLFSVFWGMGSFSSNSLQQSRLVSLATPIAAATVALNTAVVYLGQAIGSSVGGWFVDSGMMRQTPFVALGFLVCALIASHIATRVAR